MNFLKIAIAGVGSVLLVAVFVSFAGAASVEEIALYNKPDRQKILVDGARKEGKITWYTSLIVDQLVRPMKEAFEKKYPFLQIEHFRGNSERIVQKMFAEYQGKRYEVDIVDGTVTAPMVKKGGFLQRFHSPHLADYPAELKDPQGFWGVSNVYFFAVGYNTRMVKPGEVPKTYEDLLNPRWKGQMMWSTSRGSGAPMMIGNILQSMGQEAGKTYLQKFKGQNVAKTTASNRQLLDLVIAGEYPLGLHIFNHHAHISRSADLAGNSFATPPCGDAIARFYLFRRGAEGFSSRQLFAVPPQDPSEAGRPQTRRWTVQARALFYPGLAGERRGRVGGLL
jgi:ABC-type thiamine transport system substrate-binding protein